MNNPPPHLILEHCTVENAGLIDLTNSPASSQLEVEVNHCAVKAEALLAFQIVRLSETESWVHFDNLRQQARAPHQPRNDLNRSTGRVGSARQPHSTRLFQ